MHRTLRRAFGPVWFVCCSLFIAGCCSWLTSSSLADGIVKYDRADYPEALASLRQLEAEVGTLSAEQQARYALYRGLSELSLGNACDAYPWLTRTQRWIRTRPSLLDRADRGRLAAAWNSLGKMPGELK